MIGETGQPDRPVSAGERSDIFAQYGLARYGEGDTIGGRYTVHGYAAGGFGQVYFCYDQIEDYFYALKTFKLSYEAIADPATFLRLQREVDNWMMLGDHDHIVRCFSMAHIDNLPFIILEWVADDDLLSRLYVTHHDQQPHFLDWYARLGRHGVGLRRQQSTRNTVSCGTSLANWIKKHGTLPIEFALQIALDICAGLAHANYIHEKFVHRDLNPRNVLLNEQRRAKVSDFGLSVAAQELQESEKTIGSYGYMAPEQWRGEALDLRTDIYALGCTLYEMVVGEAPFTVPDDNPVTLRRLHEDAPPPPLPTALPAALNNLIQTCLQKDPAARFATWQDLSDALVAVYKVNMGRPPQATAPDLTLSVDDLNRAAAAYYTLGYYAGTLHLCERAIKHNSAFPNSYNNRGCAYHRMGQREDALADYTQAIRLGRRASNATVRNNRGLLFLHMGDLERALRDLIEAVETEPTYANAHTNLGLTYTQLGRYEEALTAFDEALRLAPTHVLAHHNRGFVLTHMGRVDEALQDYDAAAQHDPTFLPPRINRMLLYRQLGRHDEAENEEQQTAWISERKGRWQDGRQPGIQLSFPDPQFINLHSVEDLVARPLLEAQRERRRWLEATALAPKPEDRMPLHAVVTVKTVDYADTLHERVLEYIDLGHRVTQLTLQVVVKQGDGAYQEDAAPRTCGLWLDEEAMRTLSASGLQSVAELQGRWLVLVNDYPDDLDHPLRLYNVL